MNKIEKFWNKIPKTIRKTLIFIAGSTVILTGLFMLIFPGPGWAAIFVGFAILATEFTFAEKARDWLIKQLERLISSVKKYLNKVYKKLKR